MGAYEINKISKKGVFCVRAFFFHLGFAKPFIYNYIDFQKRKTQLTREIHFMRLGSFESKTKW